MLSHYSLLIHCLSTNQTKFTFPSHDMFNILALYDWLDINNILYLYLFRSVMTFNFFFFIVIPPIYQFHINSILSKFTLLSSLVFQIKCFIAMSEKPLDSMRMNEKKNNDFNESFYNNLFYSIKNLKL